MPRPAGAIHFSATANWHLPIFYATANLQGGAKQPRVGDGNQGMAVWPHLDLGGAKQPQGGGWHGNQWQDANLRLEKVEGGAKQPHLPKDNSPLTSGKNRYKI